MSSFPPFELPFPPAGEESDQPASQGACCRVLSQEEIAALLDFFLLLDEWDRRRKVM